MMGRIEMKYVVYVLFGLVCACTDNGSVSTNATGKATVLDSQINALEKAKAVDQQVQDAVEKARKTIEESGG